MTHLISSPPYISANPQTKPANRTSTGFLGIGFKKLVRNATENDEPKRRVVVRGWRKWSIALTPSGISISAPIRPGPAVLEAEKCARSHCSPSCKPPCHECECGVYLRYEPPSLDESTNNLVVDRGHVSVTELSQTSLDIWFFCEALGKVIYGDIGARAERIKPLWGFAPQAFGENFDDMWRKLRIYLPAYFGPHLQLFRLDNESIATLKRGEVWES